jgi:hypothetical protein
MHCRELKNNFNERLGALFLEEHEKSHLQECTDCRQYYESLQRIESASTDAAVASLTPDEFATMQLKLDDKINRYQMRAISFYHWSGRLGAALGAFLLVVIISLWSGLDTDRQVGEETSVYDTYYLVYNDDIEEEPDINEQYIDLLLFEYTSDYGFMAGDMLLDDITSDELEYLDEQLKAGDIL